MTRKSSWRGDGNDILFFVPALRGVVYVEGSSGALLLPLLPSESRLVCAVDKAFVR